MANRTRFGLIGLDGLRAIEAAQAATDSMLAKGVVQRRDVGQARNWFDGAGS